MKKRILIVEDDAPLARVLRDNLTFDGFDVTWADDGDAALDKARAVPPDLIVLDLMLPSSDGFDLCSLLRQGGHTPIIILTGLSQKADKLRGLNLGADDYITKPFDLEEFLARVRAVLRRARPSIETLTLGEVTVDFRARRATTPRGLLHLTYREFELLQYLAERQERAVYRGELLHEVWGYANAPTTRSVDHAIARLRKKIEPDPRHPTFIHTVHGDGYYLSPNGVSADLPFKSS
jgi:two-component system alkaline phosphatase synthesis response regulator PhoP